MWDLVERCCLPSLDAHKAALSAPAWSPDSRFLATAAADCTLRLWRVADGRQQAFFMGDGALTAVCFAGGVGVRGGGQGRAGAVRGMRGDKMLRRIRPWKGDCCREVGGVLSTCVKVG